MFTHGERSLTHESAHALRTLKGRKKMPTSESAATDVPWVLRHEDNDIRERVQKIRIQMSHSTVSALLLRRICLYEIALYDELWKTAICFIL